MRSSSRHVRVFALALASGLGLALAGGAQAQEDFVGEFEYMNSCATCHGEDGKGGGPLAKLMTVPVPDLTTISDRNEGVFPARKLVEIIDGRSGVRGHGYPMPVWGARFKGEAEADYGPYGAEFVARARTLELVFYLLSLQE